MGASSGIGLYVAEAFASRGIRVGLAARRTDTLRDLKEKYPAMVEYESIDITHRDAPAKLSQLIAKTGGMDIYFHVSGIGKDNPTMDPQLEVDVIEVNAAGFARMLCAAYNYFRDECGGKGRIAAVTSVAGTKGMGLMPAYSSSKAFDSAYMVALEQLSNMQGLDIKYTDIRPGWIRTPLLTDDRKHLFETTLEEAGPEIIRAIVRHPRVAVIGWRWKLLTGALSLLPDAAWIHMSPSNFE